MKELLASEISHIIEMAWDDETTFAMIQNIYGIPEDEVKKIMKKNLKTKSYKIWRERVTGISRMKRAMKS